MTHSPSRRSGGAPRALRIVFLLALAGLLSGCANESGVLARVRGQAITAEQFNEVARANTMAQALASPDSAKARLLKDLVDRELLVQGALGDRLDQTPEFQTIKERLEAQVMREALYQLLLAGPYPVSEAETRALYDRRATATRARLIFAFDQAFARQAAGDLARGEDFAVVADRYNPTGFVPPGGDTGFLQPGSLLPPLDDVLRTAAPGSVVGPLAAGTEGWFIVRIEERKAVPQPPYTEAAPQLVEMLRQRKQRAAFTRVYEQLKAGHHVVVVPGAAQFMSSRLRAVPGEGPVAQPPPPPGPEDRRRVLCRYDGGTYTLGEAYDDLIGGASGRVDLAVTASVVRWLQSQAVERAAVSEARRRRLGEDPAVQRRLRERLNNYLLDGYYQKHVLAGIAIAPDDYRAAYERFRSSFVRLRQARVASITFPDSAAAAAFAQQAGRALSLRDAASTAGLGGQVRQESLAFPSDSPQWTQFENHIMMMAARELAGPIPVDGGWLVFQLIDKQQDAPSYDDLPLETRVQLQGVATEMKREARLGAVTDSLRQALAPVVVYEDRLRRLPWPPAPLTPPGS